MHAFIDDDQVIADHLEQSQKYGDDSGKLFIVAADEGDQLFTADKLDSICAAKKELLDIAEVQTVTAFVDAYRSRNTRQKKNIKTVTQESLARNQLLEGLVPEINFRLKRYWDDSVQQRKQTNLKRLKAEVLSDERLVGKLISADGQKHSMLIALRPEGQLSIPRQQALEREIRATLETHGVGQKAIYTAGLPAVNAAMGHDIQSSFTRFLPIGFLAIAVFVFLIYRDFRVTGLIVLIGGIAVVWALGITSLVFGEVTILVAGAPLVILAVSTTDFLHLTTAYQISLGRKQGLNQEEVLSDVLVEVGGACALTSLTTFVGFASLVLSQSVSVRQFGFACAVGTSVALLLMITLLPIAYRRMRPLDSSVSNNTIYRFIDKLILACDQVTRRFPRIIFFVTLAICLPGIWLIAGRPIDSDLPNRFPADHPVRQSLALLESDFSGANSIDLYVTGTPEQLLAPPFNRSLGEFINKLEKEPDVLETISVMDIYEGIEDSLSYRTDDGLPPTNLASEGSLKWVAKIEPALVESLITPERDELRVRIMMRTSGFRQTNRLAEKYSGLLQKKLGQSCKVQKGGAYTIIGSVVGDIVRSQIFGFVVCTISLTLILMVGLGSWRVGLMAQIPNLVPVLLMVSLVAFCLDRLDSDLVGLPMIALGIVVDDTIHFLNCYRLEYSRGKDPDSALKAVFQTTGRSIVISTFALCLGLLPLAMAQMISLWMLGTFLVVGVLGALIADLLCLPAMIRLGLIKYGSHIRESEQAS